MISKILIGVFILIIAGIILTGQAPYALEVLGNSWNKLFTSTVTNLEA